METLEVHSKDFLIKWVNVPDNSIIDWQVKPLKKSINFSIYKKNEVFDENEDKEKYPFNGSNASSATVNSTNSLQPPSRNRSNSVSSVNKITESFYKTKSRSATLTSNINNGDLTLIKNYNKLISNELVHGKLEVLKLGVYAFIFDNSFSKTIGKKILFSSKIIEKETKSSHSPTTMPSIQATLTEASLDAVNTKLDRKLRINDPKDTNIMRPKNGELLQSILLKKRRKKLQGFVKRYFVLNLKYGTLSYFRVNDSKLRGQMPITQSIISANVKRLEIIVDSGMEIWDLKALNKNDFDIWVDTFNSIKKSHFNESDEKKETFEEDGSVNGSTVDELHAINKKINNLLDTTQDDQTRNGLTSISNDVERLIGRFSYNKSFDAFSVFSNNEFYDAKEILDGGVVELPDEDDYEDDFEEEDDSSLDSDDDDAGDLSVIKESDSVYEETEPVEKEVDGEDNDNNLSPLPLETVSRPNIIPEWTLPPTSILAFFRKNVGKDLTSISMPVDMNEPVTILQKYAELLEYCDLIDNALEIEDYQSSGEKILRIAAFAVSGLSSVREKERNVRKPFNPLLGETFELIREDKGIRLISEKVCHRPPVFATFVESENWSLSFSLSPSQKFWGKTAEINNKGSLKLTIKSTGEVYTWQQPTSMLKNIIAGEKYTEPVGTMTIKSSKGDKAVVEFAKGGMFSGRSEELSIEAFDARKKKLTYSVFGKWTESLTLKTNTTEKLIWECGEMLPNAKKRFGFTKFASELVLVTDIEKDKLAPTDSRLRPDLKAYLKADIESAETLKNKLEEDQRTRRKENETSGKDHQPLFFHHVGNDSAADSGEWVYSRGEKSYWNRRANGDWDDLLKLW